MQPPLTSWGLERTKKARGHVIRSSMGMVQNHKAKRRGTSWYQKKMWLWYLDCIPLYHHVPLLDHHVVILSPWYPQYIPHCLIHTHLLSKSQAAKAGTMAWRHASLSAFTMWKWSAPGISTSTGPSNVGPNALNTYPLRMVFTTHVTVILGMVHGIGFTKKMHLYSPCLLVVSSCVPIMVPFSNLT